jgi:hypothetical protein
MHLTKFRQSGINLEKTININLEGCYLIGKMYGIVNVNKNFGVA